MEVFLDLVLPSQKELSIEVFVDDVMYKNIDGRHQSNCDINENEIIVNLLFQLRLLLLKLRDTYEPFDSQQYCAKILQALESKQQYFFAAQSCSACLLAFAKDEAWKQQQQKDWEMSKQDDGMDLVDDRFCTC